jgi:hypothetical protein
MRICGGFLRNGCLTEPLSEGYGLYRRVMDTEGICVELGLLMLIRYTKNYLLFESCCILKVRKFLDCGLLHRYCTYLIKSNVRWVICIYYFVVGLKKIIFT